MSEYGKWQERGRILTDHEIACLLKDSQQVFSAFEATLSATIDSLTARLRDAEADKRLACDKLRDRNANYDVLLADCAEALEIKRLIENDAPIGSVVIRAEGKYIIATKGRFTGHEVSEAETLLDALRAAAAKKWKA
jgi:hypothetical protein